MGGYDLIILIDNILEILYAVVNRKGTLVDTHLKMPNYVPSILIFSAPKL